MNHYNKPYMLDNISNTPYKYFAVYNHKKCKTDDIMFMSGENLPKADIGQMRYSQDPATYDLIYTVNVEKDQIHKYDSLPSSPTFVVNDRILKILTEFCPDDFQAFPAIIENESKSKKKFSIEGEYWVINITKLVDTIDLEKSELKFLENNAIRYIHENNTIRDIRHLVFKEGVMQDGSVHLARERLYRPHIMASPTLRDVFKKHKIKGCEFVTDDQYNRESFY